MIITDVRAYIVEPLDFHDGKITLTDRPGLGVEMNVDEIEKASIQLEWPEGLG